MADRTKFVKVYTDLPDHPVWMDLDPEHVGLWVLALMYCRRNLTDGHFPAKGVRRWGGTDEAASKLLSTGRWHATGHDCETCPQPADGHLYLHDYLEHQTSRADVDALSEKRKAAGQRGGLARAKQVAKQEPQQNRSQSKPETETETENNHARKRAAAPATAGAETFPEFWSRYPKRVGKAAAERAWAKALKRADAATILAGLGAAVAAWRASGTERQYVPNPATWLNQARWEDEQPLPGDFHDRGQQPRPSRTMAQCTDPQPHDRHPWADARNAFVCMGVGA